jgi:electron transfer flavoprotein alpha/beta subunit
MDRPIIPSDRYVKKIDQGENNFSFRLGVFAENQLENAAQLFNHKPYALNVFPTGGKQPTDNGFSIALGAESLSLVTLKKADDTENTYIARLLNNSADTVTTDFTLCGATIPLTFGRYEVKTVLYEDGTLRESAQLLI